MPIRIIRQADFIEGRWRNGLGVSWDIASEPAGSGPQDFSWRLAIARIDGDVPFSHYDRVDRVFTLLDGNGLDLTVEGTGRLAAHDCFVPHRFPGDAATMCKLRGGPCRALNLFLGRDQWQAGVDIMKPAGARRIAHSGPSLFFALRGGGDINGRVLQCGDAAVAAGDVRLAAISAGSLIYCATLTGSPC